MTTKIALLLVMVAMAASIPLDPSVKLVQETNVEDLETSEIFLKTLLEKKVELMLKKCIKLGGCHPKKEEEATVYYVYTDHGYGGGEHQGGGGYDHGSGAGHAAGGYQQYDY